mgnify:CR=1 FL=1
MPTHGELRRASRACRWWGRGRAASTTSTARSERVREIETSRGPHLRPPVRRAAHGSRHRPPSGSSSRARAPRPRRGDRADRRRRASAPASRRRSSSRRPAARCSGWSRTGADAHAPEPRRREAAVDRGACARSPTACGAPTRRPTASSCAARAVDDLVLVSDDELRRAMGLLFRGASSSRSSRPARAPPPRSSGRSARRLRSRRVGAIVCRTNIDPGDLRSALVDTSSRRSRSDGTDPPAGRLGGARAAACGPGRRPGSRAVVAIGSLSIDMAAAVPPRPPPGRSGRRPRPCS